MITRRSKRTKMIIAGAAMAGAAALGTATILPAHAATTITGTGPTQYDARIDALKRCFGENNGGVFTVRSSFQNADGTWAVTIEANCK